MKYRKWMRKIFNKNHNLCSVYEANNLVLCYFSLRKNVEDFTGPRERSDLGFVTFDITADILNGRNGLQAFWNKNTLMSIFVTL